MNIEKATDKEQTQTFLDTAEKDGNTQQESSQKLMESVKWINCPKQTLEETIKEAE
jgi:hypothetical protein